MGGFQLSGTNAACSTGATLPNGEILMTASTVSPSYTVQYALASNPGASCTGTMLWPDVRQFNESVYQADSSSSSSSVGISGTIKMSGSIGVQ
jgi:hypothetical protein